MVQAPISKLDSALGGIFAGSIYGVLLFCLGCLGCFFLCVICLRCSCAGKNADKKKRLKTDVMSFSVYIAVHFGFLVFSACFMMYMLISPRQCTESVCLSQMEMIANDLRDTAIKVSRLIVNEYDSQEHKKTCDERSGSVDCCDNLPPDDESGCIFRIGQDIACGCFARKIWSGNTSWLNKPEFDDWKYCMNDGRLVPLLRDIFNEISNKDILLRNLYISFNSSDHLVFPARKVDTLFVPVPFMGQLHLGDKCMTGGKNFSQLCLVDYNPVVQPYFTASLERKELNFVFVYDVNPFPHPEKISNETQYELLELIVDDILVHNDLSLPIPFRNSEILKPDRIYHLSKTNKDTFYEFISSQISDKKGKKIVSMDTVISSSVKINGELGIYPDQVYLVFLHSPLSDKLRTAYKRVYKIISSIFLVLGAEESDKKSFWYPFCERLRNDSMGYWNRHRKSGCVFIDDGKSFSRKNMTEYLTNEFFESYIQIPHSLYGDDGVVFVMPYVDEVENQNVISVTLPITDVEESYILVGMNIDWKQMESYYCRSEMDLYPIMWHLEDVGVYIAAVTNSVVFLVYLVYLLYIWLFPYCEKCCRGSKTDGDDGKIGKRRNNICIGMADLMSFCFSLNHVWLVIVMEALVAVMIPTFVSNIVVVFGISLLLWVCYLTLCFCGVCGLKMKVYSVNGVSSTRKKKMKNDIVVSEVNVEYKSLEESKEEQEQDDDDDELNQMKHSKKIEMKGMKMVIERIEFDSFIKGSFRNIEVSSEKLTGIMGHSGAGKSTFFNILLGRHSPKSMKVLISSPSHSVVVDSLDEISEFVGLVPQEEILTQRLTVFEQLVVQAKSKYSKQESDMISYWASQLGMDGALYDKFPNSLSGGQAKRLSCLRELVGISPIILLDEPTSGLDGKSAEELIMNLSHLAKSQGLAIVVILHQPSTAILSYFDHLYLFLKDKETVECAEIPLEGVTADHLDEFLKEPEKYKEKRTMNVIPEEDEKKLKDNHHKRMVFHELFSEIKKRRVWCFVKFAYIFFASCLEGLRDVQGAMIDILVISASATALIAIFNPIHPFQGRSSTEIELCLQQACGDVERNNLDCSSSAVLQNCSFPKYNPLYLQIFMTMFSVGLVSLITSLRLFGEEKKNMKRLFRSGVNFFHYYLCRLIVHIPRMLLSVYLFLSLVYNTTCLTAPFWYYYIICMLLYALVTGQGVVCSLLFPNKEKAVESTLLGMICISSSLLFSGIIVTENQISDDPVKQGFYSLFSFFKFFSYAFYGNEFLYVREILEYKSITPLSVRESINMYGYSHKIGPLIGHGVVILVEIILWYLLGLGILYFVYTPNPWNRFSRFGNWCVGRCCGCCFGKDRREEKDDNDDEEEEDIINIDDEYNERMKTKKEEKRLKEEQEGERLINMNNPSDVLFKKDEDYDKCTVMIYHHDDEEDEEDGSLKLSRHNSIVKKKKKNIRRRRIIDDDEEETEIIKIQNEEGMTIEEEEEEEEIELTQEELEKSIIEKYNLDGGDGDESDDVEENNTTSTTTSQPPFFDYAEDTTIIMDEDDNNVKFQLLGDYQQVDEDDQDLQHIEQRVTGRRFFFVGPETPEIN